MGPIAVKSGAKPGTGTQNKAKRTNKIDFVVTLCKQGSLVRSWPRPPTICRPAVYFRCGNFDFDKKNQNDCTEARLDQSSLEHFAQEFLFLCGELLALRRQVEHVDGLVTFRVDQRDLNVASQARQSGADIVQ